MITNRTVICVVCLSFAVASLDSYAAEPRSTSPRVAPAKIKDIKSYCLDFNWWGRRFAGPGTWANADPEKHVQWYKMLGANVIQTFAVSCNGYAWYRNGVVPEQPGLKHDFLTEMVRLGHEEGMLVMAYFNGGANTRWGKEHPDLSYGTPPGCHIPYTDEYLAYLSAAIGDAVRKTGIDGFMVDWLWQPNRPWDGRNWKECEKKLYAQLMGEAFGGKVSKKKYDAYSRKAIDRAWKTIHKAAKDANPDCIIWLTCHKITHPHVVNSRMFKEVDWLMNEAGDLERVRAVRPMVGKHTRLITCLAAWNRQDATTIVPAALKEDIGLYGFAKPGRDSLIPLERLLKHPVSQLKGDMRSIAVLARVYNNVAIDTIVNDKGEFVQPVR